jgi:acyl-CoA-binding protein
MAKTGSGVAGTSETEVHCTTPFATCAGTAQSRELFDGQCFLFPLRTMSDLQSEFEAAQTNAKLLNQRPDNPTLLKIYALYKQATAGDNTEKKPAFSDFVARAKWDAWTAQKGLSADTVMRQYIELIESLRENG